MEVAGHIGYGVRPSARRKEAVTAALKLGVREAHHLGIDRVLLCVAEDNGTSQNVIEKYAGIYDSTIRGMRRFGIAANS
ncbi:GNAT family N-acetyltransferase [Corynebacterium crudilactis]|uniref:GNAT family N-acetyltransferase n=1 Tax=Corynebacterium crudilactis TaxID=1652495 RepID=UPI000A9B4489|nr:GNAT family N-acetyltransferase [Corynebacterium crudilactis]